MIFNSIPFVVFLPATFIIYWLIGHKRTRAQNVFLLIASYFFYGWWDWRFLSLLFFSSLLSYILGGAIYKSTSDKKRKLLLYLGVIVSLGFLGFFKYYNFFIQSFADAFTVFGSPIEVTTLKLILPLGISFYTFKLISYLMDVYRGKIERSYQAVDYFVYVGFFAQITAGPIERASNMLPQLKVARPFNKEQATEGLKLILWGMFKKVVIADTCALYVGDIFNNSTIYPASVLLLGTFYFAFQVYADFSGYSDIAMGIGKLFGFELMQNFNHPFSSKNITDFWRRWHISLSSWFNDYVFTPAYTAMRNWGNAGMFLGIFITFLLSGLWHGASWHYVLFGSIHGLAIIYETYTKKKRKKVESKMGKTLYANVSVFLTFIFILLTFIIFRANNIPHAFQYIGALFSSSMLEVPGKLAYLPWVFLMIGWEWLQRKKKYALYFPTLPMPVRWSIYLVLTFLIFYYYGTEQQFYYFQF
jgi:alginate O-acetyltransferase complex protein AlgI